MNRFLRILFYALVLNGFSLAHAEAKDDLFHAINLDNGRMVASLLERGVDPNSTDEKGQSALLAAIRDDAQQAVAALLTQPGLKLDVANRSGETPLMMAALKGRLELMRTLLDRGAAVNRAGWTPLHYAASGPEPKAVSLLLEKGADIEALSPNRTTPLMMAARYGALDSADLLLARGASVAARNEAGLTAVDFARTAGRDTLVAKLQNRAR